MTSVVAEPRSALSTASTASYEASTPIQGNWAADWRGDTTNLYRGALPFAFEQAIDYSRTETVPSLLTRLDEVLPAQMSKTHVDQLRMRFPQPAAADDPATYEFEN